MDVGVVGATGQVGAVMRALLDERNFPVDELRFFASQRSAGRTIGWRDRSVVVEDADTADYSGLDVCLLSAGATASRALAGKIAAAGAAVIDNSSAWRRDRDVPLVVSEVNPHALDSMPKGIVANPNCTTMVAMSPLKCLDAAVGLEAMVVSTYQAVSGAGLAGVDELHSQTQQAGDNAPSLAFDGAAAGLQAGNKFSEPIAFNVIPLAGALVDDGSGETDEEQKLTHESRKILELEDLAVAATCVRVPVYTGHCLSISAAFKHPISAERAGEVLAEAPGVVLQDVPTPQKVTGANASYVGRIRCDPTRRNGLSLFIAGDKLRKGDALKAVQIAEVMVSRGLLTA